MGIILQEAVNAAFADLEAKLSAANATIDAVRAQAKADIDRKDGIIAEYKAEVERRDEIIASLNARIAELESSTTPPPVIPEPEPEQPQEPEQPAPGGFRWPDASTTGVPAGTVLTTYTGPSVISKDGTVVEDKLINKAIEVTGRNVAFRRCKFTYNGQWLLNGDTAKDLIVEDCEFANGVKAILGQGTFRRLNIWNCIIGITLKGGKSTVQGCYIHDLSAHAQPNDPHFDGVFISGDQTDCLIEDNLIEIPSSGGTAAIFIATRWQGADIINTTVRHNRLLGSPSYAMYSEQTSVAKITGTKWLDNEIQKGAYGYWTISGNTVQISGNVDALTGEPIS